MKEDLSNINTNKEETQTNKTTYRERQREREQNQFMLEMSKGKNPFKLDTLSQYGYTREKSTDRKKPSSGV